MMYSFKLKVSFVRFLSAVETADRGTQDAHVLMLFVFFFVFLCVTSASRERMTSSGQSRRGRKSKLQIRIRVWVGSKKNNVEMTIIFFRNWI